MSDNNDGAAGFLDQRKVSSEYNQFFFQVSEILAQRNHVMLVQVKAVTSAGALAVAGTVDVQPMVNQLDANGNAIAHGIVRGLPYLRIQGGANAIIIDPQVGDIGYAVFADKDISSVKSNRAVANPGSGRVSDYADGIYTGGLLNGIPTQYVRFYAGGIEIVSPDRITLTTSDCTINAPFAQLNGNLGVSENVTVGYGASGTFTTVEGLTVTVQDGIVTNIY